jgi:hypothetical protein
MPIFMSYSHQDKRFADRLAAHLVKHRARVWVDRWELSVGDSIIERVQSAIQEASALIVVLSKASVQSQWCKKELSAGLVRELEEKRVVLLPVLAEDCDIPMFLRDKLYADFRTNFEEGLKVTLEAVAKVTSDTLGRSGTPGHNVDWSIDWGLQDDRWVLRVTVAEGGADMPYSVLTEIVVLANEEATRRQEEYARRGLAGFGRILVITALAEIVAKGKVFLALEDSFPQTTGSTLHDPRTGISYDMLISARRLGEDTGKVIVVDCAGQLEAILRGILANQRPLTENERAELADLVLGAGKI